MHLTVEPLPGQGKYKLLKGVVIEGVSIPAGYEWNGASIPTFLKTIIGGRFEPEFMAASLVHDYLYEFGSQMGYSRAKADKIFKKLLLFNGVDEDLAKTMHAGVRIGGGFAYQA